MFLLTDLLTVPFVGKVLNLEIFSKILQLFVKLVMKRNGLHFTQKITEVNFLIQNPLSNFKSLKNISLINIR